MPADTWVKIALTCPLGKKADGTYDLTITVAGQDGMSFTDLPCGAPEFRRLDWFGFVSNATESTVVYVDDVKIEAE